MIEVDYVNQNNYKIVKTRIEKDKNCDEMQTWKEDLKNEIVNKKTVSK